MRSRLSWALVVLVALALVTGAAGEDTAGDLPIVDTHVHYSRNSWDRYSPDAVLAILDRARVVRAFVSSTPDDGTVRLWEAAPTRIVPVLRPYRERGTLDRWYKDPTVVAYLEARLGLGIHRGIGEFHLFGAAARSAVVRQVAGLAERHGLFLHCHCDAAAVEILLGLSKTVAVVWAHAGMSAGPAVVGELLGRHVRLSVELALRWDVAADGQLDPAWRALFLRHPDRFMVGTDTWIPSRWDELPAVQAATRRWLRQLPQEVAERLASRNAERLAGGR